MAKRRRGHDEHFHAGTRASGSPRRRRDSPPAVGPDPVRASDAEREAVVDRLRLHAGDGRLTLEELEERIDQAYAARTRGQLSEALRELPAATRQPEGSRVPARRGPSPARRLLPIGLLLVAFAAAAGGSGEGWAEAKVPPPKRVADAATEPFERARAVTARPARGGWIVEVRRDEREFEVRLDHDLKTIDVAREDD